MLICSLLFHVSTNTKNVNDCFCEVHLFFFLYFFTENFVSYFPLNHCKLNCNELSLCTILTSICSQSNDESSSSQSSSPDESTQQVVSISELHDDQRDDTQNLVENG